ncbi:amidohydrolase family protein [Thermoanaerobacter sp. A7A]|uniref:amidohydrolase family protein n=1 Tax=Thermoanaerobacter sp. A7A TaxID=1350366 RepID=UPI00041580D4|nr:amidohydrolase family protein [Thermoanaerobacter sp. A7A]
MYQGIKIIDFHVHFPPVAGFEKPLWGSPTFTGEHLDYVNKLRKRWLEEWDFPEPESRSLSGEEQAKRWAEEAEKNQIEKIVFVTGHGENDNLAKWIQLYPDKFIGFAYHDPQFPDAREKLAYAVEVLGFRGYKMFAPLIDCPLDDPKLKPIWEYCADKKLPVLIHFGTMGGGGGVVEHININPLSLANVARTYSDIPFVIPHFGAGFWGELLRLAWSCPNIYIDTSGSNQWVRWMPYPLDLESLFRKAYETVGPERIIFGSDSSWFPRGFARRYLQDQMRVCRQLNMKKEDLELIFGKNAARLLKLDDF